MRNAKHIVYLYSEVMSYTISVMRALVAEHGMQITCVSWDGNKKTPFVPQDEHGITFLKRSSFTEGSLRQLIADMSPAIIYVSGRMDPVYLRVVRHFRKKGIPVVAGCDNQWTASKKQIIASLLSPFLYRRYFDYIWVPGPRQHAFAQKMGYKKDRIIPCLYTADTSVFEDAYVNGLPHKQHRYPHTIAFVGRFTHVKGIDILIDAFREIKKTQNNDWRLILVGAGELTFEPSADIEIEDFMPNMQLAVESRNWGVFCLPSVKEAWGVVIHEAAAAGLPIVCSDCVGAGDVFVQDGTNGFIFRTGNKESLKQALQKVMLLNDTELLAMGKKSHELSKHISPAISAKSLVQILTDNEA